ncbi:MAG: hypothetical protein WBF99_21290 [Xanthobacteraceae bacterium]
MAEIFFYCNSFAIAKRSAALASKISSEAVCRRQKLPLSPTRQAGAKTFGNQSKHNPSPTFSHVEIASVRPFNMIIII